MGTMTSMRFRVIPLPGEKKLPHRLSHLPDSQGGKRNTLASHPKVAKEDARGTVSPRGSDTRDRGASLSSPPSVHEGVTQRRSVRHVTSPSHPASPRSGIVFPRNEWPRRFRMRRTPEGAAVRVPQRPHDPTGVRKDEPSYRPQSRSRRSPHENREVRKER